LITAIIRSARSLSVLSGSTSMADLPTFDISTPFNVLFRQYASFSLLRHPFAVYISTGILTCWPSTCPSLQRGCLRTRLTLIRLALIRKPWLFGVRVSCPHYRYLCLHLLFHTLHRNLHLCFYEDGMLLYHLSLLMTNPPLR
jgi:hypothetical protein